MTSFLLISLTISLGLNIAMFLVAFKLQSDKLTDISYALTFISIAILGAFWSHWSVLSILLLIIVGIWGIRLGGFLLYRVSIVGKDTRFDEMRGSFWKFGRFWLLQAVTVWVLMLPVILVADMHGTDITVLAWIGVSAALIGMVIEATADYQKFRFTQNKKNKGVWIHEGVWRYSRHPNYFGEILVWIGIFVVSATVLPIGWLLLAFVSPLAITILLLFVSGIPILEASADKRWGKSAAYRKYKNSTSILIPLPPKKG